MIISDYTIDIMHHILILLLVYIYLKSVSSMLQNLRKNNQNLFQCCGTVPFSLNTPPSMPFSSKTGKISLKNQQKKRAQSQKFNGSKFSQECITQPEKSCPLIQSRPKVHFSFLQVNHPKKDNRPLRKTNSLMLADEPKEEVMIRSEPVQVNQNHITSLTGIMKHIDRKESSPVVKENVNTRLIMDSLSDTESEDYNQSQQENLSIAKSSKGNHQNCPSLQYQKRQKLKDEQKRRSSIWESCPHKERAHSFSTTFSSQVSALRHKKVARKTLFSRVKKTETLMPEDEMIFEILDDADVIEDCKQMMRHSRENDLEFDSEEDIQ